MHTAQLKGERTTLIKLGWFMSKISTATSPPPEGEPMGTKKTEILTEHEKYLSNVKKKKKKDRPDTDVHTIIHRKSPVRITNGSQ